MFDQHSLPALSVLHPDPAADATGIAGRLPGPLVPNRAAVDLVCRISRGVLLPNPGPGARIRFDPRARNRCGDLLFHPPLKGCLPTTHMDGRRPEG